MRVLVDANVMLRIADQNHPVHSICRQALERLDAADVEICLVPQVMYEFWVVATRPIDVNGLGMSHESANLSLHGLIDTYDLYRDEAGVFDQWHMIVSTVAVRGKPAHDARLVAAMQYHGIGTILTLNPGDFSRYTQIAVLTPADILAGTLPS